MAVEDSRLSPDRILRELDWNLLRTFVVLAQSQSITDAARKMNLAQPSVSAALQRLENRIGRRLIDRKPGHFQLTEAGERLFAEALDIQGSILRLTTLMRDMTDEVRGHVQVALASHVVCPLLDQALAEFHAAHPKATLSFDVSTSAQTVAAVSARSASFAICLVRDRDPKLEYRRLYREFFGLFCGPPHPLFGKEGLSRSDLAGHNTVSFQTDRLQDVLKPVALLRAESDIGEQVVGTSSHLEEVRRMIVAGLGIGPLPVHVAARDVRDRHLWRLPPYDNPPAVDVHVVWNPRTRMNRAEESLLERILEKIDATPIEDRTYR